MNYWAKFNGATTSGGSIPFGTSDGYIEFYNASGVEKINACAWVNRNGVTGTNSIYCYGLTNPVVNTAWHQYSFTASGTNFALYIDGSLISNTGWTLQTPSYNYTGTQIGSFYRSSGTPGYVEYFSGLEDEVGFWTRLLSSSEITSLYNSGSGRQYPFFP